MSSSCMQRLTLNNLLPGRTLTAIDQQELLLSHDSAIGHCKHGTDVVGHCEVNARRDGNLHSRSCPFHRFICAVSA